jgi:hypothetical protein
MLIQWSWIDFLTDWAFAPLNAPSFFFISCSAAARVEHPKPPADGFDVGIAAVLKQPNDLTVARRASVHRHNRIDQFRTHVEKSVVRSARSGPKLGGVVTPSELLCNIAEVPGVHRSGKIEKKSNGVLLRGRCNVTPRFVKCLF